MKRIYATAVGAGIVTGRAAVSHRTDASAHLLAATPTHAATQTAAALPRPV